VNILAAFQRAVAQHPERIAIVDGGGRATSYAALDARGAALAAAWYAQGLRQGDRVLIAARLDADLYAALAALWRIGAAAVLPEPALGIAGLRHAIATTAPRALFANGFYRLLPLIVPAVRTIPLRLTRTARATRHPAADLPTDTPALISFTSGSTGAPKAIVRSHGFLAAQDAAVAPLIGTRGVAEVDLVAFPVFVVANLGQGITSVLPNWRTGNPAGANAAAIARHAERHGVTRMLLSPAIAAIVAERLPRGVHSIFTGGGPVFPDLVERLNEARPGLRIVSVYGSTEAEPIAEIEAAETSDADRAAMAQGGGLLAGHPVAAARVRIINDEILVAGAHVVSGYLDPAQDASTKVRDADGTVWHRTGDAGRFDDAGRLWLRGRWASRVAGMWPFEVEVPARAWPGVRRAALAEHRGRPVLAIEGTRADLPDWRTRGAALGIADVRWVRNIPLDRRHGSKVDLAALQALLHAGD